MNQLRASILLVSIFAARLALAAPALEERILACTERESGFQRLECFDQVATSVKLGGTVAAAAPATPPPTPAPTPALSDLNFSILAKRDIERGGRSARPQLVFDCQSKQISVKIALGVALATAKASVSTRVDTDEIVTESWATVDHRTGVAPVNATALTKRLKNPQVLEVKVVSGTSAPLRFSFDVQNVDRRISALTRACWR